MRLVPPLGAGRATGGAEQLALIAATLATRPDKRELQSGTDEVCRHHLASHQRKRHGYRFRESGHVAGGLEGGALICALGN